MNDWQLFHGIAFKSNTKSHEIPVCASPKIAQSVPIAHVPSFENVIFVKL